MSVAGSPSSSGTPATIARRRSAAGPGPGRHTPLEVLPQPRPVQQVTGGRVAPGPYVVLHGEGEPDGPRPAPALDALGNPATGTRRCRPVADRRTTAGTSTSLCGRRPPRVAEPLVDPPPRGGPLIGPATLVATVGTAAHLLFRVEYAATADADRGVITCLRLVNDLEVN